MFLVAATLVIAAVLLRLPVLLNARDVNSDAATVGLQAIHMLRGEWSWFLWGAGYQSSLDSALAAAAFAVFGVSPLVLMLVPLCGHLLVICLALAVLNTRVGLVCATVCVLTLVIASPAINAVTVAPPRQWCITLVFLSIWLLDGAPRSVRFRAARFALGSLCAALAVFVDLYALAFAPGMAVFAWLSVADLTADPKARRRAAVAAGAGAALGVAAVVGIRFAAHAPTGGALGAGLYHLRYRLALLWNTCLPFSLGYNLYRDSDNPFARGLWAAPMPWYLLQVMAGWSLLVGIAAGGVLAFQRKLHRDVRRLGLLGAAVAATTLAGFVISTMPVDMWTARYLGPIFWMAPFALAPVAACLGTRRFAAATAPYLAVALIGVWFSYGFYVHGALPRNHVGHAFERQEQRVRDFLRSRGIRYAAADYWLAYRFSFVFREEPIVAPIDLSQNRYAPYLDGFRAQAVKAWVFHPTWSRTPMDLCLALLTERQLPFSRHQVGDFTVVVFPDPALMPAPSGAPSPAASPASSGNHAHRRPAVLQ